MRTILTRIFLFSVILLLAAGCARGEPISTLAAVTEAAETATLTDIDGNTYPVLQIGEQVWMGTNLQATHGPGGEPVESFCYEAREDNCQTYGRLYTMSAAMGGDRGEGAQGICPDGWHIPSMSEWKIMIDHLGGQEVAGKALKETGTGHWAEASPGEGDQSGMGILPSGWFDFTGEYRGLGGACFLRSSSAPNPAYAFIWMLESQSDGVKRGDLHPNDAIPLRCVQDGE
jgi:uncharacterized protein (TIGR02145 family)